MSRFTLCVQWPRFGPYHLARLERLAERCREADIRLVGLETASNEDLYDWRVEESTSSFERIQLFPGTSYESISPRRMHRSVLRTLDEINPDVLAIVSYSFPDARACLSWSARHGRGSILMTDTKADDAPRVAWREWIKRQVVETFDAAVLAGTPQRAYYESLGLPGDVVHLGYDVVDNDFFAERADAERRDPELHGHLPGLEDESPFFLSVGRFIEVKNIDFLLRAYEQFRERTESDWRLVLVGAGPLEAELKETARALKIPGVVFAGFRQIDELPAYYARASCFVHPALKDTWALVVNEAMATGLPVLVSTASGCHFDLVQAGENGFTFSPDDRDGLVGHMQAVSSDDEFRREAGAASARIIDNWTLDTFASSMLAAADDARRRSGRGLPLTVRLLIQGLMWTPSVSSFHSAEI